MEIDFSGLWSWTLPLWALFLLVLFLVGILNAPIIIEGIMPSAAIAAVATATAGPLMSGGSRAKHNRRVRFAE